SEAGAGEVRIHHLSLRLLTFLRLSAGGDVEQGLAERDGERNSEARLRYPDVVNQIETLDAPGQCARDDQRDLRLRGALVVAQFAQPGLIPGLRSLRFPENRATALSIGGQHPVHHVAAELTLRHRLDQVTGE